MTLTKGTLFDPILVKDLVDKVQGKSSIAILSKQVPISFNGNKEFVFTMENEVDVVAESGKKSHGGVDIVPQTIIPLKIEYGARISDEFIYGSEEEQISVLKAFNDGFAKKAARGLDLMAFHGVNPRTGNASAVIGTNHFDELATQVVEMPKGMADPNTAIESAVELIVDGDVTGIAIAPAFSSALAKQVDGNGNRMFPGLAWGQAPGVINGLPVDVNRTVSDMNATARDRAIVGDFQGSLKWGYAKEVPLKVIEYGDPDNSGFDLQGYNQVYIRAELYIGWGIMVPENFVRITEKTA